MRVMITYICNSCFIVELESCTFIFDYFKNVNHIVEPVLKRAGKLFVFSSHSHWDHFSPEIFEWSKYSSDIEYILSDDIMEEVKGLRIPEKIIFVKRDEFLTNEYFSVNTFGSTDLGVSFLITIDGKHIFHAGDLNNWHWKSISTGEEVKEAHDAFSDILGDIMKVTDYADIMFFPVDPRMREDYAAGAEEIVHKMRVLNFFPMHFGKRIAKGCDFGKYQNPDYGNYYCLGKAGDKVELNI